MRVVWIKEMKEKRVSDYFSVVSTAEKALRVSKTADLATDQWSMEVLGGSQNSRSKRRNWCKGN